MSEDIILEIEGLSRSFRQGDTRISVLRDISLTLRRGEIVALLGPSGSGKSTLLQAVGLLERGFEGELRLNGRPASQLDDEARTRLRARELGFVYQFHHLLPDFSALENVVLPQLIAGSSRRQARARARDLLTELGLAERLTHHPSALSGGEQQRVAVARALANRPPIILADEPTGNLDSDTAARVLKAFLDLVRQHGSAALVATHNRALAGQMDRIVMLEDGKLLPLS